MTHLYIVVDDVNHGWVPHDLINGKLVQEMVSCHQVSDLRHHMVWPGTIDLLENNSEFVIRPCSIDVPKFWLVEAKWCIYGTVN